MSILRPLIIISFCHRTQMVGRCKILHSSKHGIYRNDENRVLQTQLWKPRFNRKPFRIVSPTRASLNKARTKLLLSAASQTNTWCCVERIFLCITIICNSFALRPFRVISNTESVKCLSWKNSWVHLINNRRIIVKSFTLNASVIACYVS